MINISIILYLLSLVLVMFIFFKRSNILDRIANASLLNNIVVILLSIMSVEFNNFFNLDIVIIYVISGVVLLIFMLKFLEKKDNI